MEEYEYRRKIFRSIWQDIKEHNASSEGYTKAINKFSDWSAQEWNDLLGFIPSRGVAGDDAVSVDVSVTVTLPSSVNWNTSGAVTGVKD